MAEYRPPPWRVGTHHGIHVYAGGVPVAAFHRPEDAAAAVAAVNARRAAADPEMVTVCAACKTEACWKAELVCEDWRSAGTVQVPRRG